MSLVNMLRELPRCFRGRVPTFENFLICDMGVLFRRKQPLDALLLMRADLRYA